MLQWVTRSIWSANALPFFVYTCSNTMLTPCTFCKDDVNPMCYLNTQLLSHTNFPKLLHTRPLNSNPLEQVTLEHPTMPIMLFLWPPRIILVGIKIVQMKKKIIKRENVMTWKFQNFFPCLESRKIKWKWKIFFTCIS